MELAPANVPLAFEVTFDSPSLNVGMLVYDDTGSAPVLLVGPVAMLHVVANTYRAHFTPSEGNYIIVKAVYTDGTLTTMDPNYAQGSESINGQVLSGGGGGGGAAAGCAVVGYVNETDTVVGFVNCD